MAGGSQAPVKRSNLPERSVKRIFALTALAWCSSCVCFACGRMGCGGSGRWSVMDSAASAADQQ